MRAEFVRDVNLHEEDSILIVICEDHENINDVLSREHYGQSFRGLADSPLYAEPGETKAQLQARAEAYVHEHDL